MIDYIVEGDGEVFSGSFVFPVNQMPEAGDTVHLPITGRDTIVRVDSVRAGVDNYEIRHVELVGSARTQEKR